MHADVYVCAAAAVITAQASQTLTADLDAIVILLYGDASAEQAEKKEPDVKGARE